MKRQFTFLDHTADIKFKVAGHTPANLFENAAKAISFYASEGRKISTRLITHVEIEGDDLESLFYKFLDEIIFLLDSEGFIVGKAEVKLYGKSLKADLYGNLVKEYKVRQIKAATYAEMKIKEVEKGGWEAQVVLDV
ncbi:archease [Candidatus Pacearchaeota archaeon]|nr:archease [Candidatus Pacearchaeota archaeon]